MFLFVNGGGLHCFWLGSQISQSVNRIHLTNKITQIQGENFLEQRFFFGRPDTVKKIHPIEVSNSLKEGSFDPKIPLFFFPFWFLNRYEVYRNENDKSG